MLKYIQSQSGGSSEDREQSYSTNEASGTQISFADSCSASMEEELVIHTRPDLSTSPHDHKADFNFRVSQIGNTRHFSPIPEKFAPEFIGNLDIAEGFENGEEIIVAAQISGRSTPEANWYVDGAQLKDSDANQFGKNPNFTFERDGQNYKLVLRNYLTNEEQNLKISCIAVNSLGAAKSSIVLGHQTETHFLSSSLMNLFEHEENFESDSGDSKPESELCDNSDFHKSCDQNSKSSESTKSIDDLEIENEDLFWFHEDLKVVQLGKGLICEAVVGKRRKSSSTGEFKSDVTLSNDDSTVDAIWLLNGRVVRQSDFSRMTENSSNTCFQLQLASLSILKKNSELITCIISGRNFHCRQSVDISEYILRSESPNENDVVMSLSFGELLNTLSLPIESGIPSLKLVSDINAQRDEDGSEITFEVELTTTTSVDYQNLKNDELQVFWLVDDVLVLNQKQFKLSNDDERCRLTVDLLSKPRLSRVDFLLFCFLDSEEFPEVVHKTLETPKLIGKPYLELIEKTETLLVEIPLQCYPAPGIKCIVDESFIADFESEFSYSDNLCSVAINKINEFSIGDTRIVLTNQIGSITLSISREEILRLHKTSISKKVTPTVKEYNFTSCSDTIQLTPIESFCESSGGNSIEVILRYRNLNVLSLCPEQYRTSCCLNLGSNPNRKTVIRSCFDMKTHKINPEVSANSSKVSFQDAIVRRNDTFKLVVDENCGFDGPASISVPFGRTIGCFQIKTPTIQSSSVWTCNVYPSNFNGFYQMASKCPQTPQSKRTTSLVVQCGNSSSVEDISENYEFESEQENNSPSDVKTCRVDLEKYITAVSDEFDYLCVENLEEKTIQLPKANTGIKTITSCSKKIETIGRYQLYVEATKKPNSGINSEDDESEEIYSEASDERLPTCEPDKNFELKRPQNAFKNREQKKKKESGARDKDEFEKTGVKKSDFKSNMLSKFLGNANHSSCDSLVSNSESERNNQTTEESEIEINQDLKQFATPDVSNTSFENPEKVEKISDYRASLDQDLTSQTCNEGEETNFSCKLSGVDYVVWYKNGRKVLGSRYKSSEEKISKRSKLYKLHISSVKSWEDQMIIQCKGFDQSNNVVIETSEKPLHIASAPKIEMPRRYLSPVSLREGDDITLTVPLTGTPPPFWSWERKINNRGIPGAEGQSNLASIKFKNVRRKKHAGVYVLHTWNELGESCEEIELFVNAPPSAVRKLTFRDDNQEEITWIEPSDDGGTPLTGYLVQTKTDRAHFWSTFKRTLKTKESIREAKDSAMKSVKIRVLAENHVGINDLTDQETLSLSIAGKHENNQEHSRTSHTSKLENTSEILSNSLGELIGSFGSIHARLLSKSDSRWVEISSSGSEVPILSSKLERTLIESGECPYLADLLQLPSVNFERKCNLRYVDLADFLDPKGWMKDRSQFSISRVIRQILSAIDFLHDRSFLYLSLHPVFIGLNRDDNYSAYLFGFPHTVKLGSDSLATFSDKYNEFFAPEIGKQLEVTRTTDSWSVGSLLVFMFTGEIIDFETDISTKLKLFKSESLNELASSLLAANQSERITPKVALRHPWFKKAELEANPASQKLKNLGFTNLKLKLSHWRSLDRNTQSSHLFGRLTYIEELNKEKTYKCVIASEKSAPVFVDTPPNEIQVKRDEKVTLTCTVSAESAPLISWSFLNEELMPGLKYRIGYSSLDQSLQTQSDESNTEIQICVLTITKCCFSDSGVYTCTASNSYGTSAVEIHLDVI